MTDFQTGLEFAYAVALQPDGQIVVTGPTQTLDFALARDTTDGRLNAGFGRGGKVITDFAGDDDIPAAVVVQPDGQIVAGFAASAQGTTPSTGTSRSPAIPPPAASTRRSAPAAR